MMRSSRREGTPRGHSERGGSRRGLGGAALPPQAFGRRPVAALFALATPALIASGCSVAIEVDDYRFRPRDAGQERPSPLLPAAADAGQASAPRPPDRVEADASPPPAPPHDAGADTAPSPDAFPPEPPRPIALGEPGPVIELAGNARGGGARAADCPGAVLAGIYYRYFTATGAFPNRLSFVAPICGALQPTAPVLAFGGLTDARWLDVATGESVELPPLRATEQEASVFCPGDEVVVGSGTTFDDPVDISVAFRTLTLSCATLSSDPERVDIVQGPVTVSSAPGLSPTRGAFAVEQPCPPGSAASALELRSGAWLDGYGLRCSLIRWPFDAGHACASGTECQSGVCGAAATCEP